jgi:hypothetical protein
VTAFKKTFIARCKLDGICVRDQKQKAETDLTQQLTDHDEKGQWHRVQWLPETQHFVNEALQSIFMCRLNLC